MTRYVLMVNLKDDPAAIEAYRRYHRDVWPEVLESLRNVGVRHMDIHLLGRRVVMILEMANGIDYQTAFASHVSTNARVAEWERLMKSLQEPSPEAGEGEWWAAMESVFSLDNESAVARRNRPPTS